MRRRIFWIGPTGSRSGYGEDCRALLEGLRQHGADVVPIAIDEPTRFSDIPPVRARHTAELRRRIGDVPSSDGDVYVYHRWWEDDPLNRPGLHVWRTMFETASVPASWAASTQGYDQIWVPTSFNLATFHRGGVPREKLRLIPSPVPTWSGELLALADARDDELEPATGVRPFRFLAVGKWEVRKGWDVLIAAFVQEFRADEQDVELLIKTASYNDESPGRTAASLTADARVRLVREQLTHADMVDLYAGADAFVLASRGEGWGRPYMEALLCGLPSIVTDWGGATDFAREERCLLLRCTRAACSATAVAQWPYYESQHWAEPDQDDLRRLLRRARSGWRPHGGGAAVARALSNEFSASAVARRILDAVA